MNTDGINFLFDGLQTEPITASATEKWYSSYSTYIDITVDEGEVIRIIEDLLHQWELLTWSEKDRCYKNIPGKCYGYFLTASGNECCWGFTVITNRKHRPRCLEYLYVPPELAE